MSYVNTMKYKIVPTDTFKILRGCGGCGCKQTFSCRNNFRVNANGNRLDIWLIYGCEKCGHTYNLSIYDRIRPDQISMEEYQKYLSNDAEMVFRIGTDKAVFAKNQAVIDWNLTDYRIQAAEEHQFDPDAQLHLVRLSNPYDIPVRGDRILAKILNLSRSTVKKMMEAGTLSVEISKDEVE